jgi:hypothetical protein
VTPLAPAGPTTRLLISPPFMLLEYPLAASQH